MTEHEKLMLRRHLESAVRRYTAVAEELEADNHPTMAAAYRAQAREAQIVIDKLNVGMLRV